MAPGSRLVDQKAEGNTCVATLNMALTGPEIGPALSRIAAEDAAMLAFLAH